MVFVVHGAARVGTLERWQLPTFGSPSNRTLATLERWNVGKPPIGPLPTFQRSAGQFRRPIPARSGFLYRAALL